MANVIDSLFVEIGLDASKFNKQQQDALERWKKTQQEFAKGGERIEDAGKSVADALSGIKVQALEAFAVFSGGKGILDFTTNLAHADAALGRTERSIGVSAQTISKWQGLARIFGGDAKTMAQSFISLSDAFAGWKVGQVSPMIEQLRQISAVGGKAIDINKGVEQSFLDLATNLKNIHDSGPDGPARAGFFGRQLGFDPALLDAMLKGPDGIQKVLDYVQKIGVATHQDIDAFTELEKRMGQMGVKAESLGNKTLGGEHGFAARIIALADELNKPLSESKPWDAIFQRGSYAGAGYGSIAGLPPSSQPTGAFKSNPDRVAFIRAEAVRQGQSPDVWERLFAGEGRSGYAGDYDATGKPTSFGAFQLHYPGVGRNTADGLGTAFTKETGLDARDPSTEPQQIAWSMRYARTHGLDAWHGWHGPPWANLQGAGNQGGSGSVVNVTVGDVHITAAPGADGAEMAREFKSELLRRQSQAAFANSGQQ